MLCALCGMPQTLDWNRFSVIDAFLAVLQHAQQQGEHNHLHPTKHHEHVGEENPTIYTVKLYQIIIIN